MVCKFLGCRVRPQPDHLVQHGPNVCWMWQCPLLVVGKEVHWGLCGARQWDTLKTDLLSTVLLLHCYCFWLHHYLHFHGCIQWIGAWPGSLDPLYLLSKKKIPWTTC